MLNIRVDRTFTAAFGILGRRWTGLILATLISGPHHFTDVLAKIPQMNDSMLSKRLKELIDAGIITKTVYVEPEVRIEYSLTEKGQALYPILAQVQKWADTWLS